MADDGILSRLSRSVSGSKRFLVVVGGVTAAALGYAIFGGSSPPVPKTEVGQVPFDRTVQGGTQVTPEYRDNLSKADAGRLTSAVKSGGSAVPTIVGADVKPVETPDDGRSPQPDTGPLARPEPPVVQAPVVAIAPMPPAPMPVQVQSSQQDDQQVQIMKQQMEAIAKLGAWPAADVKYYWKPQEQKADVSQAQAAAAGPQYSSSVIDAATGLRLPLPGTILYAEMVSEANSDAPGPVLARIVQGDLAGATLIGSFQTQRENIVISFNTLTVERTRNGDEVNKSVAVSAVAVDSKTVGTAMATDVDRHLLTNIGFTAAAAFAQGFGQAIAQSGSTTTTGVYGTTTVNPSLDTRKQLFVAGGAAAGAAGQALNQAFGNRPTTVKVASGTPMGVLFLPNGNR